MRLDPAGDAGMGAVRDSAAGAETREWGVDTRGRRDDRDYGGQVRRAVSFHRLLLGHLGEDQSRFAGDRVLGPSKIYDPGLPVDAYPPGSVYLLWFSGWLGGLIEPTANGFRVIVETPPLIADLLVGLTIYFAAWREGRGLRALIIMMLFALNPALIFDTVVWGQSDSVVALPMVVAAILILTGRYRLGWSAAAIAMLAKPQAIAFTPPLALWTLFNAGIVECVWCAGAVAARRDWSAAVPARPFVGLDNQRLQGSWHALQRGVGGRVQFHGADRRDGHARHRQSFRRSFVQRVRLFADVRRLPDRVVSHLARALRRAARCWRFSSRCSASSCSRRGCMSATCTIRWCS